MRTNRLLLSSLLLSSPLLSSCFGSLATYHYDHAESYTAYSEPVNLKAPESGLAKVNLDWIAGEVVIEQGEDIRIVEENLDGNYLPMYYWLNGDSLSLKYWKSGNSYQLGSQGKKKLTLTLPKSLRELELNLVSAKYTVNLADIPSLDIDSVSGNGTVKAGSVDDLDVNVVSGEFSLEASSLKKGELKSTSGDLSITCAKAQNVSFDTTSGKMGLTVKDTSELAKIDMDTTSGDATLNFDGVRGYNLDFHSISGKKNLEFTEGSDGSLSPFSVEFHSTSGDLAIKKIA